MYTSQKNDLIKVGNLSFTREEQAQILATAHAQLEVELGPLNNTLNLVPTKYYYDGLSVKVQYVGPKRGYKYYTILTYNYGKDLYELETVVIDTKYNIERRKSEDVYFDSLHHVTECHLMYIEKGLNSDGE